MQSVAGIMRIAHIVFFVMLFFQSLVAQAQQKIAMNFILHHAPALKPVVLRTAIKAYHWACARNSIPRSSRLTVVDFSLPSYEKRLWVIDLQTNHVLLHTYTAQGRASGTVYARHFSNQPGSLESSLGVYEITHSYSGKHGESLQLKGLEPGVNDNAEQREIVIHPAWYASPAFIKKYHRAGRSWGCFAVDPAVSRKLIRLTKGGSVLFAYAKQELHDSII